MGGWGVTELAICLVIIVILFGGGKLAGVGKSLGTSISEFKNALSKKDEEEEDKPAAAEKTVKTEEKDSQA